MFSNVGILHPTCTEVLTGTHGRQGFWDTWSTRGAEVQSSEGNLKSNVLPTFKSFQVVGDCQRLRLKTKTLGLRDCPSLW